MLLNEMKRNNSAQGRTSLSTEVIADLQKYRNMLQVDNINQRFH
jgi:DNA-binding protein H-NS